MYELVRIEHPETGTGFYQATPQSGTHGSLVIPNFWESNGISVRWEGLPCARCISGFVKGRHFFGFTSREVLKKWLTQDELDCLIMAGYHVYSIKVYNAHFEGDQVMFDQEDVSSKEDITYSMI